MSVLARAVVVLEGDSAALDKVMSDAEKRMMKTGKLMANVGKNLTTHVTLPLAALGGLAFHAFGEQEDAIARTNAVIKATGGVAGVTSEHIAELASQLQRTTVFADEVTQSAAGMLLMFTNVRNAAGKGNDVFDRTVKISQDLATIMDGDLQGAMFLVGKAMEDPGEGLQMLQRRTRAFTDEQEVMIKKLAEEGRVLEAQKIILGALEGKLKGVAEAAARTPLGQFKQTWNELGEVLEDVGQIIAKAVLPVLRLVRDWAKAFTEMDAGTKQAIVVVAAFAAAIGPLLVAIGVGMKLFTLFSTTLGALAVPVGLAVLAIGSLVAAGIALAQNWTWVKMQAVSFWATLKNAAFVSVDFVLGHIQKLLAGLGTAGTVMKHLPGPVGVLGWALDKLASPLTTAAAGIQEMRDGLNAMHTFDLLETNRQLGELQKELDAAGAAGANAGKKIGGALTDPPVPPPSWLKPAKEIVDAMNASLRQSVSLSKLLGSTFNLTEAHIKSYEDAINSLVEAQVPFNATIPGTNMTLRQMADQLLRLKSILAMTEAQQRSFEDAIQLAQQAVEAALTPTEVYDQTIRALNTAVEAGVITWTQYDAAVKKAQETLGEATGQTQEMKQALADLAQDGVSDFVDAVFSAKTNWGDFFRTMLMDVAKLIIKMTILNALFPKGSGVGGIIGDFFGGLFANGGFLSGGQVGIVGERGPELISGGRNGLSVTPMPASGGQRDDADQATSMAVHVNVSAIDSKDTARFFQENEGLVAGAMMQAFRKSSALRRRLG